MPLIQGKSEKAFGKNVGKEMEAGKPQKQALAIAYAVKRRMAHKKMAHGGMAESDKMVNRPYPVTPDKMYAHGGMPHYEYGGSVTMPSEPSLNQTETRKKQIADAFNRKMAGGGMVENEDLNPMYEPEHGAEMMMKKEYHFKPLAQNHEDLDKPSESIKHYEPSEENLPAHMLSHGGIIKGIMKRRMMAQGGMVDQYPGKDEVTGQPHMGDTDREIHNLGTENMTYIDKHPDDDFLSDEEQTPFFHFNERDEFEPSEKRKRMLSDIMRGLHRIHMGT